MSVLSRSALEASPLSDLHEIASEVGIDGFRRLRKEDLVDAILGRQGGDARNGDAGNGDARAVARRAAARARTPQPPLAARTADAASDDAPAPRSRRSAATPTRRGRRRRRAAQPPSSRAADADDGDDDAPRAAATPRRPRGRAAPRAARRAAARADRDDEPREDEPQVEGVLEVLANGSGFLRLGGADETSDDDVYVSAAQIRRCELVAGDRVVGPIRRARRSERHPSLVRVDDDQRRRRPRRSPTARATPICGAAFPSEPLDVQGQGRDAQADRGPRADRPRLARDRQRRPRLGPHDDAAPAAIELAAEEGIELSGRARRRAARGARRVDGGRARRPRAVADLGAGPDAQAQAVDRAIDAAKRVDARGGHAAVVIDSLDSLPERAARRALAAARNVPDGGTLTVIAAARAPLGGETTTILLDARRGRAERRPVLAARRATRCASRRSSARARRRRSPRTAPRRWTPRRPSRSPS